MYVGADSQQEEEDSHIFGSGHYVIDDTAEIEKECLELQQDDTGVVGMDCK